MNLTTSKSVSCIEAISASLHTHLNSAFDEPVVSELFAVPFFELEERSDIRFARVALSEASEVVTLKVADERPSMSSQTFLIGISVVRAYRRNDASRGELWLMAIKDSIMEWAKVADFASLTGGYLYTFSYQQSENIERNNKFCSRSLIFTAKRDLAKTQTTPE